MIGYFKDDLYIIIMPDLTNDRSGICFENDPSIDINTHIDSMCVEIIRGCLNDVTAFNYGNFVDFSYI